MNKKKENVGTGGVNPSEDTKKITPPPPGKKYEVRVRNCDESDTAWPYAFFSECLAMLSAFDSGQGVGAKFY